MQYLTYGSSGKNSALWYAVHQLKTVSSLCNLVAVAFDTRAEGKDGLGTAIFRDIEELLCGDNLPSLQAVLVHETISLDLLPILRVAGSRGLMRAYGGALLYKHPSDMSIGKHLSVSLNLRTTWSSSTPLFREAMTYYPRSHTQTNYIMFNRTINISCMLVSIMILYL